MFPDERSLVSRYQGQPFALLGVNADRDRKVLKRLEDKGTVTWRSWWDLDPESPGKICDTWQVDRFPALFLIDQQGMIRFVYDDLPTREVLEAHINQLLNQAQRTGESGTGLAVLDVGLASGRN